MRAPPGRAEAYLRMMAEDELRRALAYPRYEPPRPPGLPSAAQSAVRLSRPLLAPLVPPLPVAARMSGSLLGSLRPAARTAAQAAVLPEVNGARFAVAGLNSAALPVTLHAVGWGWEPRPLPGLGQPRYSWWARDDQGRWRVGRACGGNRGGVVDLLVEFGPALHPGARSLELIVRGPASQATVTLPLPWMESR